jgi:hypothetical protein
MSLPAAVYVSPSVTSFYDDFERTVITDQWLFNPTTTWWGRDTQYKYEGLASLSDSPGANYKDNSDQLATGGAIAEVAPGLNFSAAADATCSFWLRYLIEESFDYLHFQACDDGITWETLKTWSSEASTAWAYETISLGLFAGNSNVRFRFILVTDPGYNAAGSNIDNFSITPSSVDSSAPYVYYTKARDWYSEKADGFEITTRIVDFTGINYARCYYKLNGGSETYVNPTSVTGTSKDAIYFWKLDEQTEGDLVEFRIETRDTYSTPNTGSKGPFQYREGLHQKYDFATVSYYTEVVTTTAQYDQKSYAVRFSSFMDDIVGAVVRGYDDASQPNDNAQMLINVWGDNSGLPGATMITPFAYTNPATLSDTNAWGYVDLSSYTALDNIVGDFYIGFECGVNPATGVTRTTMTQTGEASEYDFGRAYIQYYSLNGSGLMWENSTGYNHHIRCITTDKQIEPGIIDTTPGALSETLPPDGTYSSELRVYNVGGYALDYTASIEYNGFASATTVHENNFNTVLGWTSSGTPAWSRVTTWDGGSLNGTGFAKISAATTGSGTGTGYLTSAIQNLSTYSQATVSWIQKTVLGGGNTAFLQASNDGTTWTTIYTETANLGAWNNGNAQSIIVPSQFLTATARFRFGSALTARSARYYAIDNIVIGGSVGFNWMTLDGGPTTSGSNIAPDDYDPMTVGYNSAGLSDGTYTANIRLASQYSNKSVFVQLTVANVTPPAAPSLVSPTNASNLVDITPYFDWSDAATATAYNIVVDNNADYSSPEIDTEVAASNYQQITNMTIGTYYWKVRSRNAGGYSSFTSSWSVNLQAPVSSYSVNDLAGQADIGATDSDIFNIGNTGSASLTYSISKAYVTAKADIPLLNNNFNSGLGWTAAGDLTWAQVTNSNNLDGTPYAQVLAATEGEANGTSAGTLTSPVFDGTTSYEVWLDFDQYANLTSSACTVEYTTDGSAWTVVYTNNITIGAWSNADHRRIKLPITSAAMQVRFTGSMRNLSGSFWSVDNVVVSGLNPANYNWLTVAPLSGSVAVSGSTQITATYNATGMDAGTYNANITVSTNDPYNPTKVIPVQFVVNGGEIIPGVPANIVTSVVSGNIFINWDDAADATNYDVYSSADPYGTFAFLANVSVSEYTYVPGANTKMFFHIVSKNATKTETPDNIEVKAIKKRTVKDIKLESSGN